MTYLPFWRALYHLACQHSTHEAGPGPVAPEDAGNNEPSATLTTTIAQAGPFIIERRRRQDILKPEDRSQGRDRYAVEEMASWFKENNHGGSGGSSRVDTTKFRPVAGHAPKAN